MSGAVEQAVTFAEIVDGVDGDKAGATGGGFDVGASGGFALDEADDADDVHLGGTGGVDGLDGGGAGGAYVVHDDDLSAGLGEAFDALLGAVLFFGFADEESVEGLARGRGTGLAELIGVGVRVRATITARLSFLRGEDGDGDDDGIGAEGHAADGIRRPAAEADDVEDDASGEAGAFGVKSGGAAIDVVIAGRSGGEGEMSLLVGAIDEKVEQLGARVGHEQTVCGMGEADGKLRGSN